MKSTTIHQEEALQIVEGRISPFTLNSLREVASDINYTCFSDYDGSTSIGLECLMVGDQRSLTQPAIGLFIGDCEGEQKDDKSYCSLSIGNAKELIKGLQMLIASSENDYKAYQKHGGNLSEDLWKIRLHNKARVKCPF